MTLGRSFGIGLLLLATCSVVNAADSGGRRDRYDVLKLSPEENAAVMRVNNGEPKLVRTGEAVGGRGAVKEIAPCRVVIVEGSGRNEETVIIRLQKDGQTVERLRRHGPKRPMLLAPGK